MKRSHFLLFDHIVVKIVKSSFRMSLSIRQLFESVNTLESIIEKRNRKIYCRADSRSGVP
jgi:hypothetical protein